MTPSSPSRPLRIVYLITRGDDFAGSQLHVRDLAAGCRARGHDAIVLAGSDGPLGDACRELDVPFHVAPALQRSIHPARDLRALAQVRRWLKQLKPDLVTCHAAKAGFIGRLAATSLRIPVLYTAHGWQFALEVPATPRRVYRALETAGAQLGAGIITVCEEDRRFALRYPGFSPEHVHTVYNAMSDVPASLRADPTVAPPRLLMVARTAPQKDHPTLFRALAQLTHLPWHLDLVGDGPSMDAHIALAKGLGLAERVTFHGFQRDIIERLSQAQIFLLVTNWEGFPYATLEAMRAGLPVVASNVGGVGEAIVDGETGFLVPHQDVQAVRAAVERLLTSPELRAQMGAAGRALFEAKFTFDSMLDQTLAIYERALHA